MGGGAVLDRYWSGWRISATNTIRNQSLIKDITDVGDTKECRKRWANRMVKIKELSHLVEQSLLKSSIAQGHRYNLRRQQPDYKIGDLVLRQSVRQSSASEKVNAKLLPKYEGPYEVRKVSAGGVCHLVDSKGKSAGKWHPNKLKSYVTDRREGSQVGS